MTISPGLSLAGTNPDGYSFRSGIFGCSSEGRSLSTNAHSAGSFEASKSRGDT